MFFNQSLREFRLKDISLNSEMAGMCFTGKMNVMGIGSVNWTSTSWDQQKIQTCFNRKTSYVLTVG